MAQVNLKVGSKFFSSKFRVSRSLSNLIQIETNKKTGISVVTMNAPPVNKISMELLNDLNATLNILSKSQSKGIILTSASSQVFSEGLDILELC